MLYYKILFVFLLGNFILMIAFSQSSIDKSLIRSEHLQMQTGDIKVALVWPTTSKESFIEGAMMAVDEINSEEGGLLEGRKLEVVHFDEYVESEKIPYAITKDLDYVAVLGYLSSGNALVHSVVYETNGLIMITAGATNPKITGRTANFLFRTITNDAYNAENQARFTAELGFDSVVILNVRSPYGYALADYYKEFATKLGIKVVAQKSYNSYETNFRPMLAQLSELKFDALFLAGGGSSAANVIKQSREMWISEPIIGGDGLNNMIVPKIAKDAAEGMYTFGFMDPKSDYVPLQKFIAKFKNRYGYMPDDWHMQGYDTMSVFIEAVKRAKSIDPTILASTFRYSGAFNGPAGPYNFTDKGDIDGGNFVPKVLVDGEFIIYRGGY